MATISRFIDGALIGAVAMYLLDPDRGRRRRTLVRDQGLRLVSDANVAARGAWVDASNRLRGLRAAAARGRDGNEVVDDLKLIERVRARIGRLLLHPHAIQVGANRGHVTVSGPVLAQEVRTLLDAVHSVRGVASVDNHLDVHDDAGSVPGLQGEGRRSRGTRLHPTVRAAGMTAGGLLAIYTLIRRPSAVLLAAGIGAVLAAQRGGGGDADEREGETIESNQNQRKASNTLPA
ncbi:MAG TPA: BON domain-containing protein [Casimicrobiaceae bacterium]|nr:BON domain-containing protein [Casimicrobiaceae bacterium]